MDRGAWRASVHGVTKSQTRLCDYHHCVIWDLSSLTRGWACALYSGSAESQPLNCQGSPHLKNLKLHNIILTHLQYSCSLISNIQLFHDVFPLHWLNLSDFFPVQHKPNCWSCKPPSIFYHAYPFSAQQDLCVTNCHWYSTPCFSAPMAWLSIAGNKQIKYKLMLPQIIGFPLTRPQGMNQLFVLGHHPCSWPSTALLNVHSSPWGPFLESCPMSLPLPSKLKPSGLI